MRLNLVMCFLTLMNFAYCQKSSPKVIEIGQKVPDLVWNSIVNYSKNKSKLSDFKGKPLILDLWWKGCSSCISAMPKMQELQRKFGDDLQIIALTFNTLLEFNELKKKSPVIKEITAFPFALGDTLFEKLFDIAGYPTHVWIDKDGILRAVARSENTTEKNIGDFINGKEINFNRIFRSRSKSFGDDTSLLVKNDGEYFKNLTFHSLFMKSPSDINISLSKGKDYIPQGNESKRTGIRKLNMDFLSFITMFWGAKPEQIVVESEELKKYFRPKDDDLLNEWEKENSYAYELDLGKPVSQETLYRYARYDIERFFGVKAEWKYLKVKRIVLQHIGNIDEFRSIMDKFKSKSNESPSIDDIYPKGMKMRNYSIGKLIEHLQIILNYRGEPIQVIDHTGYDMRVDMTFDYGFEGSLDTINSQLKKYNLKLVELENFNNSLVITKSEE